MTTIEDKKEVQEQSELYEIDGTDSDEVIAHMLQAQYNSEHDLQLKRTENKFNRNSKGPYIVIITKTLNFLHFTL